MTKDITVAEIKEKLDVLSIEYDDKLKKKELLALLEVHEAAESSEEEAKTFITVHRWKDLEDNDTIYRVGDYYPRNIDTPVSDERIAALSSTNNKTGKALIKEAD